MSIGRLLCTATAWIFIPPYFFAIPWQDEAQCVVFVDGYKVVDLVGRRAAQVLDAVRGGAHVGDLGRVQTDGPAEAQDARGVAGAVAHTCLVFLFFRARGWL